MGRWLVAWRRQQHRDRFFRQAKQENYRARSAYKLLELNRRVRLVRAGEAVLDLGAAPGSWSQVLAQLVGPTGKVVAVDLNPIGDIEGVTVLRGDICDPEILVQARNALGRPADAVVSDVSPPISGIRDADQARSIELADCSLRAALDVGRAGARFVVKVFQGADFDDFVKRVRGHFRETRVVVPEATRQESRETYVVGIGRR